jgi:GNAT superfamily N-acetyltransferase
MSATLSVHAIDRPAEFAAFFRLAAQTFVRDIPVDPAAADWQRFTTEHPGFHPESLRGAFLGDSYVGGYIVEERRLRAGAARVRTGCIGAVVTDPDRRRQGIGRTLMWDAIAHARSRGLTLLLLNGAAHFYDPFGYIDVFDRTEHAIACADVRAQPPSPYHVHLATVDDTPSLLALYQRHYGPYTGSFDRTLNEQAHVVRFMTTVDRSLYARPMGLPRDTPLLAVDTQGEPRGYLSVPWGPIRSFGCEAAADDWPAALALLQHHVVQLGTLPEPPDQVRWSLPPDASALHAIADHLPVHSHSYQRPHAGWMAYIVDVPALVRSILPAWQDRLMHSSRLWTGTLAVAVDEDVLSLAVGPEEIRLLDHPAENAIRVHISRPVLTQLLFGYRPIGWAAGQQGQQIPPDLMALLSILFPAHRAWIPPTDGC